MPYSVIGYLFFLLQTYAANKQVPDSASTASAMFSGTKCNYRMIGLDPTVSEGECEKSLDPSVKLTTLATLAQKQGKATGKNDCLLLIPN